VRASRKRLLGIVFCGALLGAGCLESKPAPVNQHVPEAGTPPPADAGFEDDADPDAPTFGDGGAAPWTGTWMFVSGSQGLNCSGTISVTGTEGFLSIGPDTTGRALTVVEDGCSFRFTVAGDTATKNPSGQACAKWAIPVIPQWTLTLQSDGTIEEKLGGQVLVNGETCMVSGKSTLRRQ